MTFKHITKQYSQETLEFILADYEDQLIAESGGESIRVSQTQIYIDNGTPTFFDRVYNDREVPIPIMVSDLNGVIEPNFSEDWVITVVSTVKFD